MINLIFYIGIFIIAIILAICVVHLDELIDRIIFGLSLNIQERTLSEENYFLKYELYRKGLDKDA